MRLLHHVYSSSPHNTYLLGIAPHLPHKQWYSYLVGTHKFFRIKHIYPPGTELFILAKHPSFAAHLSNPAHPPALATPTSYDIALLEVLPLPPGALNAHF